MADAVVLVADLFPGAVTITETGKRPDGVPKAAKLHVVVSTTEIVIGWDLGSIDGAVSIGWVRLNLTGMDTSALNHTGGVVGPYTVQRAGGCACGKGLKRWNPYAGQTTTQLIRGSAKPAYGLPQRYTRA